MSLPAIASPSLHTSEATQQTWRVSRCLRREQRTTLGSGQPVSSVRAGLSVGDASLCHRALTVFGENHDHGDTEEAYSNEKNGGRASQREAKIGADAY